MIFDTACSQESTLTDIPSSSAELSDIENVYVDLIKAVIKTYFQRSVADASQNLQQRLR